MKLLKFQKELIEKCFDPAFDTIAISIPRGNGKSFLAALVLARLLNPASPRFLPGQQSVLLAGSLDQARIIFSYLKGWFENSNERRGEYSWRDSSASLSVQHKATGASVRVISSNAKTAFGLVNVAYAVCDEPGAWETRGGELMHDALATSQGKPGSPLKIIFVGTLAPARSGWWHDLILRGTAGRTFVKLYQGGPKKWDNWANIRKSNPLISVSKSFAEKLKEERDEARADTRLAARFKSFRLNYPSQDESETLLTTDDWKLALGRKVAERDGQPIVGVDLGAGRSWSAAVAIFPGGRCEALAICPGIPDLEAQEKRDRVPSGTYRRLVETGRLTIAEGLRVPPVERLVDLISQWSPWLIVADRFRASELEDFAPCEVVPRVSRWSEAAADIRSLRKLVKDGPLNVEATSRGLLTASLATSIVKNDEQGNTRLTKRDGKNGTSRDDVAAALVLAAGEHWRQGELSPGDFLPFVVGA